MSTPIYVKNKLLGDNTSVDVLYHLGISGNRDQLRATFGDVRYVCFGGTGQRMRTFAERLQKKLGIDGELEDLGATGHRYAIFKVGPVLSVSHGIGSPSFLVALHEVVKLLEYARCRDATLIRIGTSGGLGVEPGSVVVSNGAVNDTVEQHYDFRVLGKIVKRPCVLDAELAAEIVDDARRLCPDVSNVATGKTMGASDFYEAQGRLDGAICAYTDADKMSFLKRLQDEGVVNIEMEAAMFSAFCHHVGIRAAIVCVTLVDRLRGDQVATPNETLLQWQNRPLDVVAEFIAHKLRGHVSK